MIRSFFREELLLRKDLFQEAIKMERKMEMLDPGLDGVDENIVPLFSCPEIDCRSGFPYYIESGRGSIIGYGLKIIFLLIEHL
ncbi:Oidioi.mRNA.OKI2018_I69.chr1.g1872.t1.cds [Oikopleura dioica]|uniref:Oidioi.mRNA.OKI2018_I69.chr1.g1872.t1.cds n=1 Tax=Oikopleura dioica TaxID=34765 RepID=A0ABN7SSQ9_OIKDI|nr:Oidioi.mRNA.OKI2018_I69.chr1.g1872.t1.cds [Oikopleura dioica]